MPTFVISYAHSVASADAARFLPADDARLGSYILEADDLEKAEDRIKHQWGHDAAHFFIIEDHCWELESNEIMDIEFQGWNETDVDLEED